MYPRSSHRRRLKSCEPPAESDVPEIDAGARASGVQHLCTGTTWNTSTAASATCRRSSAIPVRTMPFWPHVMSCMPRQRGAIQLAGHAIRVTGALSVRSPSTPNVTPSLRSTFRKNLFSHWLHKLGDNYLDARRVRRFPSTVKLVPLCTVPSYEQFALAGVAASSVKGKT